MTACDRHRVAGAVAGALQLVGAPTLIRSISVSPRTSTSAAAICLPSSSVLVGVFVPSDAVDVPFVGDLTHGERKEFGKALTAPAGPRAQAAPARSPRSESECRSRRRCNRSSAVGLELPDALARQTELLADLLQAPLAHVAADAEAELEHEPLPLGEMREGVAQPLPGERRVRELDRVVGRAVGEQLAELGVAAFADGLVQRDRRLDGVECLLDVLELELRQLGQLGGGRLAAVRRLERARARRSPGGAPARAPGSGSCPTGSRRRAGRPGGSTTSRRSRTCSPCASRTSRPRG